MSVILRRTVVALLMGASAACAASSTQQESRPRRNPSATQRWGTGYPSGAIVITTGDPRR
jgi:hypothetical protein